MGKMKELSMDLEEMIKPKRFQKGDIIKETKTGRVYRVNLLVPDQVAFPVKADGTVMTNTYLLEDIMNPKLVKGRKSAFAISSKVIDETCEICDDETIRILYGEEGLLPQQKK